MPLGSRLPGRLIREHVPLLSLVEGLIDVERLAEVLLIRVEDARIDRKVSVGMVLLHTRGIGVRGLVLEVDCRGEGHVVVRWHSILLLLLIVVWWRHTLELMRALILVAASIVWHVCLVGRLGVISGTGLLIRRNYIAGPHLRDRNVVIKVTVILHRQRPATGTKKPTGTLLRRVASPRQLVIRGRK